MMRSLYSGVSGLKNHQTAMDVIGNNIANVNTVGFKSSRVIFSDIFSQTISAASGSTDVTGGVNANQIGLGVKIASIDMLFSRGGAESTGENLDVMIEGDGFFEVRSAPNADGDTEVKTFYTRAGNFYIDSAGYLVTYDGMFIYGVPASGLPDGWDGPPDMVEVTDESGEGGGDNLAALQFNANIFREVSITTNGEITALFTNDEGEVERVIVGRLPIVQFQNQAGLEKNGGNYYTVSPNSGTPIYRNVGQGAAKLNPGTLEMSNVDLSQEFTKMITTQRGFQANSRIITVSDTMLEELVNLKR